MKFGSTERTLAIYSGVLSLALTTAYLGGLAAREERRWGEPRTRVSPYDSTLPMVSDQAAFSGIILGGAATISSRRER
ncbi:hypothetical protein [Pendulispora albinea]|uniref:Uncharacterized protein n=1 Tax=Pendulispora albinea TaxID=2741071 RepID=A0ABZ2LWR1_9BACT